MLTIAEAQKRTEELLTGQLLRASMPTGHFLPEQLPQQLMEEVTAFLRN